MTKLPTLKQVRAAQLAATVETMPSGNGRGRRVTARPVTVVLADVAAEEVRWLWPGRIPFGKVTVLEGDPGLGKSTVLLDLAARLSRGRTTPDGHPMEQASSILLSAEDGLGDTIRPRLEAGGADCSRIHAMTAVSQDDRSDSVTLPLHISALRAAIEEHQATLVVIDPLTAFLGSEVNSWRDHDIRRALRPLAEVAEMTGAAIVVVRHLTKGGYGPAIYRGGGSIGIAAAARSVLLVARDPDDEGRRILAVTKSNLSVEARSLSFQVEEDGHGRSRVRWLGTSHHRANELVAVAEDREAKSALEEAVELLTELLVDGPRPVADVEEAAKGAGIAKATLRRARARLGIRSKPDGFAGRRLLILPPAGSPQRAPSDDSEAYVQGVSATDETGARSDDE